MSIEDSKKPQSFEKSLNDLEIIVEKMEKGDLSLEEALKQYEKGTGLVRNCQKTLADAEKRIQLIMEKNGELTAEAFSVSEKEI